MSGYDCPFHIVKSFEHDTRLSHKSEKSTVENLYCNKEETKIISIFE